MNNAQLKAVRDLITQTRPAPNDDSRRLIERACDRLNLTPKQKQQVLIDHGYLDKYGKEWADGKYPPLWQ